MDANIYIRKWNKTKKSAKMRSRTFCYLARERVLCKYVWWHVRMPGPEVVVCVTVRAHILTYASDMNLVHKEW